MLSPAFIAGAALMLAALRIGGLKSESFQAVAHMFDAGLFAYGWTRWRYDLTAIGEYLGKHACVVAVLLALVELACFIAGKFT